LEHDLFGKPVSTFPDHALSRADFALLAAGFRQGKTVMDEPERPQLSPYQVELEAGRRYAWCRCGRSKKQPFCDGTHAGTGIEPLMFTAERTELALLCGCKDTGDPPFCDGSHMLL
jgi:CDGSH-type Zn-finger protein